MSPHDEVALTAAREFRRNLSGAKGVIVSALFVLGGAVPILLQLVFLKLAGPGAVNMPEDAERALRVEFYTKAYSAADVAEYIADCPMTLFGVFQGTLFFLPLLVLMLGFDQTAGEAQHRTLRYLAGRAERGSIVLGKALGLWGVVSLMTLVLYVVVVTLLRAQGSTSTAILAAWGARLWIFSSAYAGAYAGLIGLMSATARTPAVALFTGFGALVAVAVTYLVLGRFESVAAAQWAFPAEYQRLLVSPNPARALAGIAALVAWGGAFVFVASEALKRRDL